MVFGFSSKKKQDGRDAKPSKPSKLFAFRRKMHEAVAHIETRSDAIAPSDAPQAGYQQAMPYGPYGYQVPMYPQAMWGAGHPSFGGVGLPGSDPPPTQPEVVDDDDAGDVGWMRCCWTAIIGRLHTPRALERLLTAADTCRAELQQSGSPSTIAAMLGLLGDQQHSLGALEDYARDKQLLVLCQIYREVHVDAFDESNLLILLDVLGSGPDYLIDIATVECIIWQAEVIDPAFGIGLQKLLDGVVAEQSDLPIFRERIQSVLDTALNPPPGSVDDDLSRDATASIHELVRKMRDRIGIATAPAVAEVTPSTPPAAESSSTLSDVGDNLPAAESPAILPGYASYTAQQLGVPHPTGSGPVTGSPYYQSTPLPSPRPASPASTTSSQKSIFEYRGHRLTRSALDLVLRQEMLATADSSGQYAGEVSFDDVRNAWIPKWAAKLRTQDLADGEVPDTNPANYTIRTEDEWGNKIGWWNGRMYYEEEPKFG